MPVEQPGASEAEPTRVQGALMRDVMKLNAAAGNFRIFSPDELTSNRWDAVLEATSRMWSARILDTDSHVANDGRVLRDAERAPVPWGWLEGYLLTGRHGFFSRYEAFIHIVDSMFNQHAKVAQDLQSHPLAAADRVAQLPPHLACLAARITTASATRTPGFIDHVVNKTPEVIRVYLPPDANTLLSVTDHCLRSRNPRQRHRRRQAAAAAVARDGRGDQALQHRGRYLDLGQQRCGANAGCRHRLCGGCADVGGARRGSAPARLAPSSGCASST